MAILPRTLISILTRGKLSIHRSPEHCPSGSLPRPPRSGMGGSGAPTAETRRKTGKGHSRPEPSPASGGLQPAGSGFFPQPGHSVHEQPGGTGPPDDQGPSEGLRMLPDPGRSPGLSGYPELHFHAPKTGTRCLGRVDPGHAGSSLPPLRRLTRRTLSPAIIDHCFRPSDRGSIPAEQLQIMSEFALVQRLKHTEKSLLMFHQDLDMAKNILGL